MQIPCFLLLYILCISTRNSWRGEGRGGEGRGGEGREGRERRGMGGGEGRAEGKGVVKL